MLNIYLVKNGFGCSFFGSDADGYFLVAAADEEGLKELILEEDDRFSNFEEASIFCVGKSDAKEAYIIDHELYHL